MKDDDDDEISELPQKKHVLKQNFKEKFEKLKEKRLKIVNKNLKKEQAKLDRAAIKRAAVELKSDLVEEKDKKVKKDDGKLKEHILNYNKNIKNLDWKQIDDDVDLENEKLNLEKNLNEAIKTNNIKLAEEVNEKLIDYDSKLHINYAVNAYKYENNKIVGETNQRKKLKWQFEAKERWESKANM